MAKKKVAAKSTPVKKTPAKKTTKKKVAAPKVTVLLSNDGIGHTAGQVWQTLSDGGNQTAAALKKEIDAPGDVVMAAVGWLAREEKLDFVTEGRAVKIGLR